MSDSKEYSTDDEPVQEAMAIDSDPDEDQGVETAQVLEMEVDEASPEAQVEVEDLPTSREGGDASADAVQSSEIQDASHANGDGTINRDTDSKNDNEDEEEEIMAAVIVEGADDETEEVAEAEVVEERETRDDHAIAEALSNDMEHEVDVKPKKKTPKKVKKRKKKPSKRSRAQQEGVPQERLDAAATARDMLLSTVPRLPLEVSDSHVVRSFGRLHVQDSLDSPFSSASALYPVGFSCDRYEFSPLHGRVLKLRCTILDGSKLSDNDGTSSSPIFRVMWGQGVDDDSDNMDYPYDPYTASAPITGGDHVDAVAFPLADASSPTVVPEVGMRVKVRFGEDEWYGGTLLHVTDEEVDKNTKRKQVEICIQYDDGSTEDATFPDPDIKLNLPGDEDEVTAKGVADLTELHGKPVASVSGGTPIEAWGRALLELGLIDEIIFESAMEALVTSREEGRAEAMGKIEAQKLQRQQARLKNQQKQAEEDAPEEKATTRSSPKSQTSEITVSPAEDVNRSVGKNEKEKQQENEGGEEEKQEESTEKELELRAKVAALREELETLQDQDRDALIGLTDARINKLGPLFSNPFRENDPAFTQQASWLQTVIRKEKAKMGSTGNRKKVVTRTDLLERNDTFYSGEIESLLEGLPGSELCPSYVFQELRSGGAAALSQAWVHEAEIRQEKQREKKLKSVREAKAKASQQRERELKKRKREEVRDARKRQKMEEAEQKKKLRVEERLSRLGVQVDERLFKEACFQREKVVLVMSKALGKEFARRRKAAELVSGNLVVNNKRKKGTHKVLHYEDYHGARELPPLSRVYDEEILRVWDFVASFGSAFTKWGFMNSLPSLDSLQSSIDAIKEESDVMGTSQTKLSKAKAVVSLIDLAVALSKPLAASLTKLLFASLIALNPGLQKDYGASFFAEVNATTKESLNSKDEGGGSSLRGLLPVNKMTWQEVARVAFLSDAFGELGYSRQETAHLLRGYRSGGHPNSKEAKRLRRTEEFSIDLLRQTLAQSSEGGSSTNQGTNDTRDCKVRVHVPCFPSTSPPDWKYYLHNVKSLPSTAINAIKGNISQSVTLLKSSTNVADVDSVVADLNKGLHMLGKLGKSSQLGSTDVSTCNKAKRFVLQVLDSVTGEPYSTDVLGHVTYRDSADGVKQRSDDLAQALCPTRKFCRQRMGLLNSLALANQQYKDFVHAREEFMADALRLKEDMERKEKKAEDSEDDDEEEEDDEEEVEDENNSSNTGSKPTADEKIEKDGRGAEDEGARGVADEASTESASGDKVVGSTPAGEHEGSGNVSAKESPVEVVASVVDNGEENAATEPSSETKKIGRSTQFDDFCEDIPDAHELIRRCLAVLRTLCQTGPAEPFVYPVDPQGYPGYYEALLKPMCLREVGRILQEEGQRLMVPDDNGTLESDEVVEDIVAQFGRNVRLINQNCSCYSNVGASIISSADEMLRIFERLFLDWVLAPEHLLPPLDGLDDDRCVEYHPSDEDSLVLLCDGCEGKYNMSRLDPPLLDVPKGDWFCPRCLTGRCFENLDPRIGKKVLRKPSESQVVGMVSGVVQRSKFRYPEGPKGSPSLIYIVKGEDGVEESWTLEDIDDALARTGDPVPAVRCIEAVAESPGYGRGTDRGFHADLVPVPLNPGVSDAAAQASLSSTVFRDTIACASSLLLMSPDEMSALEWTRLLILLTMKCASSEMMLGLASKMENQAAEDMSEQLSTLGKVAGVTEILTKITEIEEETDAEEDPTFSDSEDVRKAGDNGYECNAEVLEADSSAALIVEADNVEVVEEAQDAKNSGTGELGTAQPEVVSTEAVMVVSNANLSEEDTRKKERATALVEKDNRHKVREDSIAAYCIKNQLLSVVASFEEDAVSQVVDSSLTSTEAGLSFSSCRCRGITCHFCGLSDIALGSPLLRVPDDQEWNDLMPHAFRSRRIQLVADIVSQRKTHVIDDMEGTSNCLSSDGAVLSPARAKHQNKLVAVSLRVGGELISNTEDSSYFEDVTDGCMLQFLPRNEQGFQMELRCRLDAGLPFMSGSLSAHECCAIAAHEARKEQVVQEYRENRSLLVERDCGMTCGRTLSLGMDEMGRSYWKFHSDSSSLFVCVNDNAAFPLTPSRKWHKYSKPEEIASVIVSLGKQEVARELKRTFSESARMVKSGKWSEVLQKRFFKHGKPSSQQDPVFSMGAGASHDVSKTSKPSSGDGEVADENSDDDEPFVEGEDVLVESISEKLLWDATVIGVSKSRAEDKVNGYRVHYKDWSSRFDEWVEPFRVVEPNENNLQVQEELLDELQSTEDDIPPLLENMLAVRFLNKRDRSRGSFEPPNFSEVARVGAGASSEDKFFATLKAALLLIESSLPIGAIDNSESGPWRPDLAAQWRSIVLSAQGPSSVMRCMILLEDALSPEWLNDEVGHMLSCMPLRWKAVGEASTSSLALRIFLIDQGIKYSVVDRHRYASPRRKK